MEIMKVYIIIFSMLLIGFEIRGIAERISMIITAKNYYKQFKVKESQDGIEDN